MELLVVFEFPWNYTLLLHIHLMIETNSWKCLMVLLYKIDWKWLDHKLRRPNFAKRKKIKKIGIFTHFCNIEKTQPISFDLISNVIELSQSFSE